MGVICKVFVQRVLASSAGRFLQRVVVPYPHDQDVRAELAAANCRSHYPVATGINKAHAVVCAMLLVRG
jgi:methylglyoxal synthase